MFSKVILYFRSPNLRRKVGTHEGDIYLLFLGALHFLDKGMMPEAKAGIIAVIGKSNYFL